MQYNYSIIIPHYNSAKYLEKLLPSIPERDDTQVIIVDDGSTKDFLKLEELKNRFNHFEWYKYDENKGPGFARNIGLKLAKGKYILFSDADDFFPTEAKSIFDDYIEDDYDIIYFDVNLVSTLKTKRKTRFIKVREDFIKKNDIKNIKFKHTYPWGKLIKNKIIKDNNIKFGETIRSEDVMFSLQIDYYAKNIKIDDREIYNYIVRDDSLCARKEINLYWLDLNVLCDRFSFLKKNNIENWNDESYLGQIIIKILNKSWKNIFRVFLIGIHKGVPVSYIAKYASKSINFNSLKNKIKVHRQNFFQKYKL